MKAFRGQPSVFASAQSVDRRAELEVKKVFLNFGGVMALHDVDLTVRTGALVSVIGPNGPGKTSLLNCITGYYHPQKGQILFNGEDVTGFHPHEVTRKGLGGPIRTLNSFQGLRYWPNAFGEASLLRLWHR